MMDHTGGLTRHDAIIPLRKGVLLPPPGIAQEARLERQGYTLDLVVANDSQSSMTSLLCSG